MTIVIVGEAWGREEAFQRKPFVGVTGRELNRLLEEAQLLPPGVTPSNRDLFFYEAGIHLTNVFNFQPPANQLDTLCGPRWGTLRPLRPGKYLREEFLPELDRLSAQLRAWQPNLIIALGATALWFLTGSTAITKSRGAIFPTPFGKALATFHPAYLMRGEWRLRPVVVFDFIKAARERTFPEIRRPEREVFIPETVDDIESLLPTLRGAARLSIDIETAGNQITCIGFAWSQSEALTIPIIDGIESVWSLPDEQAIWRLVKKICEYPVPKVFQNGTYDLHFLWRRYGISTANCEHDTMLLSHALYPEVQKGLGFLGSIYTDEAAWKTMRTRTNKTLKREDA